MTVSRCLSSSQRTTGHSHHPRGTQPMLSPSVSSLVSIVFYIQLVLPQKSSAACQITGFEIVSNHRLPKFNLARLDFFFLKSSSQTFPTNAMNRSVFFSTLRLGALAETLNTHLEELTTELDSGFGKLALLLVFPEFPMSCQCSFPFCFRWHLGGGGL